ncbi:hypothetical protein [Paraoerskovia sediminicola]|uniref:hypothetical protein n=1 Tax=Paraoerskovia sediminicola TaxID=1138587 RepID=UPI00257462EE|nr:hypothetical protein [Paraoerskovia sediminicola]
MRELRASGLRAWATMDAGPNVKVLCPRADRDEVSRALGEQDGVTRLIVAGPGPDARVAAL